MSSSLKKTSSILQMLFFGGLLVLIPPVLAFLAARLVYNFVEDYIGGPVAALVRYVLPHDWLHGILRDGHIPGLSIVTTVLLICAVGLIARYQLGQIGLKLIHLVFERIPGVRIIYSAARKFMESLADPEKKSWKKVVFFAGPFPGSRIFGFLTGEFTDAHSGVKYAAVACMHAPLPTSGFVVWIPFSMLTESDLTVEQALQLNGSMGVVGPHMFKINGELPAGCTTLLPQCGIDHPHAAKDKEQARPAGSGDANQGRS